MTPHNSAKKGEIAKIVLMPGDPLRAKFIAEKFLDNAIQVNSVRNMHMYTGTYKGKPVSICASGMGQPSIGIYSYELFKFYDVESIIRVGSAGSYYAELKNYQVFLATEAFSDSSTYSKLAAGIDTHLAHPSADLNAKLLAAAQNINLKIETGRVHSSDVFYANRSLADTIKETGAKCVEMESFALFVNAQLLEKKAACLLTISDNLVTHEVTSAEERQTAFVDMIKVALEML